MRLKLEVGLAWKGIDRRLDRSRSRRSLGERLLVGGGRGWILLCRGRLCCRRQRTATHQHGHMKS